jgi:hypothetical protein
MGPLQHNPLPLLFSRQAALVPSGIGILIPTYTPGYHVALQQGITRMTTIYLSSTYEDLKAHRTAVFNALRQTGYQVIAMEDYVARDDRPLQACLKDVDQADIYVGLFAFRYGYIPPKKHGNPDGMSITELEFRRADASPDTHCLIFLLDEKAPWSNASNDAWTGDGEKGERIRKLREELAREKMGSFFSAPYELASKVQSAIKLQFDATAKTPSQPPSKLSKITWDVKKQGSPYPGLLHFTRRYAPVFFGREAEVRELLDRLAAPEGRFVIVSGDSGSGKSSLVDAGVLSRLEDGSENGSLYCVRMVPSGGANPFDALLRTLRPLAERAGRDDYQLGRELAEGDKQPVEVLKNLLCRGLEADRLLLFLDQMEELFTTPELDTGLVQRFLSGLYAATLTLPIQVIATIRSDLLHHCYVHTEMLAVLKGSGHYPLGRTAPHNLHEMIVRPALCAGVNAPEDLASRLIDDVGAQPGNLPLLAFVLQRLFDQRDDTTLTLDAYQAMGGLTGAIAEHVGEVEHRLAQDLNLNREQLEQRLSNLFEVLVRVDIEGLPTRRRAQRKVMPDMLAPVVEALVKARLLTTEGEGIYSVVSVAHERLFEAWPALAHWVATHQDELLRLLTDELDNQSLLIQGQLDANEWQRHHHDLSFLWHSDRLQRLQGIIERLPQDHVDPTLRDFAWPQQTLIRRLDDPELTHATRDTIGHYLSVLGDPRPGVGVRNDGTPDIEWVLVTAGEIELKKGAGRFSVKSFNMARYLVTNIQFQAFIDAQDGYSKADWWQGMAENANNGPEKPRWAESNHPRDTVSWYEAVAFCRWMSRRLGFEVRLPTEMEWQQAATGGNPKNVYPWGGEWHELQCNTVESGLNHTTAVGLYPSGASAQGILDLSGNLWEWCLNKFNQPADLILVDSNESRVLRGGSCLNYQEDAHLDYRDYAHPSGRYEGYGFRVLCASPIR